MYVCFLMKHEIEVGKLHLVVCLLNDDEFDRSVLDLFAFERIFGKQIFDQYI